MEWKILFITYPLPYICNKCLALGILPTRLTFSVVKPIYKSGDRFNISNFRPIYLLTPFSKVFTKIIYSRMYQHMVQNQILAKKQFGFRSNSSTDNASYT
jgi:hypothetical protein